MPRRTLVYILKRRFYGRWIQYAIYHRPTCWHITGPWLAVTPTSCRRRSPPRSFIPARTVARERDDRHVQGDPPAT